MVLEQHVASISNGPKHVSAVSPLVIETSLPYSLPLDEDQSKASSFKNEEYSEKKGDEDVDPFTVGNGIRVLENVASEKQGLSQHDLALTAVCEDGAKSLKTSLHAMPEKQDPVRSNMESNGDEVERVIEMEQGQKEIKSVESKSLLKDDQDAKKDTNSAQVSADQIKTEQSDEGGDVSLTTVSTDVRECSNDGPSSSTLGHGLYIRDHSDKRLDESVERVTKPDNETGIDKILYNDVTTVLTPDTEYNENMTAAVLDTESINKFDEAQYTNLESVCLNKATFQESSTLLQDSNSLEILTDAASKDSNDIALLKGLDLACPKNKGNSQSNDTVLKKANVYDPLKVTCFELHGSEIELIVDKNYDAGIDDSDEEFLGGNKKLNIRKTSKQPRIGLRYPRPKWRCTKDRMKGLYGQSVRKQKCRVIWEMEDLVPARYEMYEMLVFSNSE